MARGGVPPGVDLSSGREGMLNKGDDAVGVPGVEGGRASVEGDTNWGREGGAAMSQWWGIGNGSSGGVGMEDAVVQCRG